MNRMLKKTLVLGALASLPAFAHALPAQAEGSGPGHASVTVHNARSVPVVVYLDRGLFDVRLGTVAPHSDQALPLPTTLEKRSVFKIYVHPEGGRDLATSDLQVTPGADLKVYVPDNDVGFLPPPPEQVIPNPGVGTTTVTLRNHRNVDVTLYADEGGLDVRVGTVPAGQEKTFLLPKSITDGREDVELFVHPERGIDLVSQSFALNKGAHLLVDVPAS